MAAQARMRNLRIGDILKSLGYIDDDALEAALAYQRSHRGVRLGETLIHLGFITEDQMLQALSQRLDVPIVDVSQLNVDMNAVRLVPEETARETGVLPVALESGELVVVTNDPINYFALEEVRQVSGYAVSVRIAKKAPLERAIDYYYREASAYMEAEDASADFDDIEQLANVDLDTSTDADAPIVHLLNTLIHHAYVAGASDVHIEPFEGFTAIRIRVDGVIDDYLTIKRAVHAPLIARIKIVSNMDIAERYMPQDGHFHTMVAGNDVNVRVSVIPTVHGEKAVLRLLSNNTPIDYRTTYGMGPEDYEKFCHVLDTPNGIIYLTGPTGSGKTTTLYMVLQALANEKVNISTIEDPVERNLARVNQMQVNETAGLTFGEGLRALMRQDPDIIMVGETRDAETASIAVRAAITGHLVLSTLHTNDAASSVDRLVDMGVAPYMVATSLAGIVAQRLMRKVCPHCATQRPATDRELELLGAAPGTQVMLREGAGCHNCNQTGYKNRLSIHEVLVADAEVKRMVADHASSADIRAYARSKQGMKTLQEEAAAAVLAGQTTMEEFLKIAYQA